MKTVTDTILKLETARLDLLDKHQRVEEANLAFTEGMQNGSPSLQLVDALVEATQAYDQASILVTDLIQSTQKHFQDEAKAVRKRGITFPKHQAEAALAKESEQYTFQNLIDALVLLHSGLTALSEVVTQYDTLQERVEESLKRLQDAFLQMKKLSIASEKDGNRLQDMEKKVGTPSVKREVILEDLQQIAVEWQTRIDNSLAVQANGKLKKLESAHPALGLETTLGKVRNDLEKRIQDQTVELTRVTETLQAKIAEQARAKRAFETSVEERVAFLQEMMLRERELQIMGGQLIPPPGQTEEHKALQIPQDHSNSSINDFVRLGEVITATIKWWWLLILVGVLAAMIGYGVSQRQTPIYQATTTLLVGQSIQAAAPDSRDIDTSERLALTYASITRRQPVLQSVVDELGLDYSWQTLIGRVRAMPVDNTQLLEIVVEANSPEEARLIANEVARALILLSPSNVPDKEPNENQLFVQQQLDSLPVKIKGGQAKIEGLERALLASSSADQVKELQQEIYMVAGLVAAWEDNYARLLSATKSEGGANNLSIVEPAQANPSPVRPRVELNTLLAGVVGLFLAFGFIFVLKYFDDSIKSTDDLARILNLTPLGAVGHMNGQEPQDRLITAQGVLSPVSEAYRMIRTNLQFMSVDQPHKAIMVTSATPEEGKSTTAANLGVVLAHAGLETIIVDADLRRPTQRQIFQLKNQKGLTDLVRWPELDIAPHLFTTEVAHLRVLTSGSLPPNPSEILGSQRMEQLLNRLQEMADVVIFDSPPVGAFSDAAVLASKVDGVVLVVKAGRPQRDIVKSVPMLRQAGANLLGGVLNGVSIKQISSYYGRYYSAYDRERTESLPVYARWINKLKSLPSSKLPALRGKSGAGRSSP